MSLLAEIRRRKVFQVAAVYAVVSWLLVQIVATVEAPLRLPDWFDTAIIVLLAVGFPIALILSWAYDITPGGLVRDSAASGSPETGKTHGRKIEYVLLGLLLISSAWIAYRELTRPGSNTSLLPDSIAVLPFENLSPNVDDSYFALGIHEQIIGELQNIRDLTVIARTSVMQYAGAARPITDIANELHVEMIMEGTVRYADGRVRVSASLSDGVDGTPLWNDVYDGSLDDIFAIQSAIAIQIAAELEAELSAGEQLAIARPPTTSSAALQFYMQARATTENIAPAEGSNALSNAIGLLDRAIELDNNFAEAYARKAQYLIVLAGSDPGAPDSQFERRLERETAARQAAERALELDPGLGAARVALANVYLSNWRFAEAQTELERAIETNPNDAEVVRQLASYYSMTGAHTDAIRLGRRFFELDPDGSYHSLGILYLMADEPETAYTMFSEALEQNPAAFITRVQLGRLESMRGDSAAALERARLAERVMLEDAAPIAYGYLAHNYALAGDPDSANRLFQYLVDISNETFVEPAAWAYAYLAIRDKTQALQWLERASTEWINYPMRVVYLQENAFEDSLLDDPDFVQLRTRLVARN